MTNSTRPASIERLAIGETPGLIRLAWRIVGSVHDAEEIVQAAFLETTTRFPGLEKLINPEGFLRHLVTCRSVDLLRKRRETQVLEFDPPADNSDQPEAIVIAKEWNARLQTALGSLSRRKAEVFALRYLSNTPNAEIAKHFGLSENAVAVTLRKARLELQSHFEKEWQHGKRLPE